jgi:hypothetical protein
MEAADATAQRHEATILVVDDEKGIREMLQQAFSEEGYRVLTAKNAIEAIDMIEAGVPDLVVSDVMMPVLDGGHLAGIGGGHDGPLHAAARGGRVLCCCPPQALQPRRDDVDG